MTFKNGADASCWTEFMLEFAHFIFIRSFCVPRKIQWTLRMSDEGIQWTKLQTLFEKLLCVFLWDCADFRILFCWTHGFVSSSTENNFQWNCVEMRLYLEKFKWIKFGLCVSVGDNFTTISNAHWPISKHFYSNEFPCTHSLCISKTHASDLSNDFRSWLYDCFANWQ